MKSVAFAALAIFAGAAGACWWTLGRDSGAPEQSVPEQSVVERLSAAPAAPAQPERSAAAAPPRHDPNAEPHETAPTQPVEFPVYDARASVAVTTEAAPAEAAGAAPANERAAQIRSAGEGAGADDFALLAQTLRGDAYARNRLLAVNSLRRLAENPALAPRVLELLRAAQDDTDPNVARHARFAYDEIAGR